MEKKLEQLADDLMSLSKEDAQRLQIIIKAKLMPEVERQRGLLQQNPQMAQMGQPQPMQRPASQKLLCSRGHARLQESPCTQTNARNNSVNEKCATKAGRHRSNSSSLAV